MDPMSIWALWVLVAQWDLEDRWDLMDPMSIWAPWVLAAQWDQEDRWDLVVEGWALVVLWVLDLVDLWVLDLVDLWDQEDQWGLEDP